MRKKYDVRYIGNKIEIHEDKEAHLKLTCLNTCKYKSPEICNKYTENLIYDCLNKTFLVCQSCFKRIEKILNEYPISNKEYKGYIEVDKDM